MTEPTCEPFKPETWPADADGFAASLCTDCGKPVRYGSRHNHCLMPAATNVVPVNFGSAADMRRAELADALSEIAEHIRAGELEHQPHGWVLLLHSDANPRRFEVLNKGIRNKQDMEHATRAMRHHIETT